MSGQTSKAVIINSDSGIHKSFYAYTRPVKKQSDYLKISGGRVINLDPPHKGDVCEAYRQIRIKAQNKRIIRNAEKLAAEKTANRLRAEAEARAAEQSVRNKANRKEDHQATVKRMAWINKMKTAFEAGLYLEAPQTPKVRARYARDIGDIKDSGLDIVTVSTPATTYNPVATFMWVADNFERPPEKIHTVQVNAGAMTGALMGNLREALNKGYLIKSSDIAASTNLITRTLSMLRQKEKMNICIVRNSKVDNGVRGWIFPCDANGLNGAKLASL